jgi:hypothetical protein
MHVGRYLMAMGVMKPAMYTSLLTSAVLAGTCSALTSPRWCVRAGFEGLAWAYVLSANLGAGTQVLLSWLLKVSNRGARQACR